MFTKIFVKLKNINYLLLNSDIFFLNLYIILVLLNLIYLLGLGPIILFINAILLVISSFYIGPFTLYKITLHFYIFILFDLFNSYIYVITHDVILFFSLGRLYFITDLLDIHILFCVDILSISCSGLVLILGLFTLNFSVEYMFRENQLNYVFSFLTLFIATITLLFFSFDLTLILGCWELIGLLSYILVNYYRGRIFTIKSAFKTFLYSRFSDGGIFFSYILISYEFNTTDLTTLFTMIPFYSFHSLLYCGISIHFLSVIGSCLFFSASIKAAQFWWHVWLPDAMDAPTPASALIHSSTLVIMGIYVLLRFSLLLEFTYAINIFFAWYGSLTIAIGAISAVMQTDLKKLIAYSTISQIGYLFLGCGLNNFNEVLLYLIMHALNKATLFIIAGCVIHYFNGNTDMRYMGALNVFSYDLCVGVFIIWANLSGLPYLLGFFSKEFLLIQCGGKDLLSFMIYSSFLISFICTPIYTFILLQHVLFGVYKSYFKTLQTNKILLNNIIFFLFNLFNKTKYKSTLQWVLYSNAISNIILNISGFLIFLIILFGDELLIYTTHEIFSNSPLTYNNIFINKNTLLAPINNISHDHYSLFLLNKLIYIVLGYLGFYFILNINKFYYCQYLILFILIILLFII